MKSRGKRALGDESPNSRKGELRARLADDLLSADRWGDVRVAIGRASDFIGPRTTIANVFHVEMTYLWKTPLILDDTRIRTTFGIHSTPLDEAIESTTRWASETLGEKVQAVSGEVA
jgi:hypothetical protein